MRGWLRREERGGEGGEGGEGRRGEESSRAEQRSRERYLSLHLLVLPVCPRIIADKELHSSPTNPPSIHSHPSNPSIHHPSIHPIHLRERVHSKYICWRAREKRTKTHTERLITIAATMSYTRRRDDSPSYRYQVDEPLGELLRAPRFRNQRNRSDIDWSDIDFPDFPPQPVPESQQAPGLKQRLLRAASIWLLTALTYLVIYCLVKQCLEKLGALLLLEWHDSLRQLDAWVASMVRASHVHADYYYYKMHPSLQHTWSLLSRTLPPLLRGTYAATSRLAVLLHRGHAALPRLLQTSQKALTALPGLLHRTRAAAIASATQILHHVRSASGTPACPSAECRRIAARASGIVAMARGFAAAASSMGGVLAVVLAASCAHWLLSRLIRGVMRVVMLGRKWSSSTSSSSSSSTVAVGVGASGGVTVGGGTRQAVQDLESLRKRAESASLLLEVFSRTVCDGGSGAVEEEQRDMVATALKDVVGIGKELGIEEPGAAAGGGGGGGGGAEAGQTAAGLGGEGVCVVCYDGVADMVVLPCRHLALCVTCCDGMSIRERNSAGYGNAKCPICRTTVMDRMKIFRS